MCVAVAAGCVSAAAFEAGAGELDATALSFSSSRHQAADLGGMKLIGPFAGYGLRGADLGFSPDDLLSVEIRTRGLFSAAVWHNPAFYDFQSFGLGWGGALSGGGDDTVEIGRWDMTPQLHLSQGAADAQNTAPKSSRRQNRVLHETAFFFKTRDVIAAGTRFTPGLEAFVRHTENEFRTVLSGGELNGADIDGVYFGLMAALRPQWRFGSRWRLVGDLSAGAYVLEANGTLSHIGSVSRLVRDRTVAVGLRGRAHAGLGVRLSHRIEGLISGGVDYWSAVPHGFVSAESLTLKNRELVDIRLQARMTIAFGE
jgi:hypothetical protein